jgi:hypothetical protein
MAKIGSGVPPSIPRSRPHASPGPDAPRHSPPPNAPRQPAPVDVQAQQVAQQFGTAFRSAGKLATQLVKDLITRQPTPPKTPQDKDTGSRTPRASTSSSRGAARADASRESEPRRTGADARRTPAEAGPSEQSLLGAAFAALKRARVKSARKNRYKQAGKTGAARVQDSYNPIDEDDEDAVTSGPLRVWLRGDDSEDNGFEQARRELLLLEQMDLGGQAPSSILRHLNGQLASGRTRQFKRHLSAGIQPQLDGLATRVDLVPTGERRQLSALIARAAHQAGAAHAASFDKLLAQTATAEAQHLLKATGSVAERAAEWSLALRRTASHAYRLALVDQAQGALSRLAGELRALPPEALPEVCASLLRAAESLPGPGATQMAEAFVTGLLAPAKPAAMAPLAEALGLAVRARPGGGFWMSQVMLVLAARGEADAASKMAQALQATIQEARRRGVPGCQALLELQRKGAPSAQQERIWSRLDIATQLAAGLLPTCGALHALRDRMPAGAETLATEALLLLGSLHVVGATRPGQRALRQALLEQERGEWTFLNAVPQLPSALASPPLLQTLAASGLLPLGAETGGSRFLPQVAEHACRMLVGPLLARARKGTGPAARNLLYMAIHLNAELFGLSPQGAGLALVPLERLRAQPDAERARECAEQLRLIAQEHPPATPGGRVESLDLLLQAFATSALQLHSSPTAPVDEDDELRTSLAVVATHGALAKQRNRNR